MNSTSIPETLHTTEIDPPRPATSSNPPTTAHEVDQLFKKWSKHIANTFTNNHDTSRRNANSEEEGGDERSRPKLDLTKSTEIQRSVFEPASTVEALGDVEEERKMGDAVLKDEIRLRTLDHNPPLSHQQFNQLVEQVRLAIAFGIQPKLNSKGSSGSYFALSPCGDQTLGIFKPSDEDPYGSHNPKLLKYIHRTLHHVSPRIVPFGRSCLIPGQSYVSESAASLLDRKLESFIVPRTEVVGLTSEAFHFDWIDRERAKKSGNWRVKEGSFQIFMKGFTDASDFFLKHPYPPASTSRTPSSSSLSSSQRRRRRRSRCFSPSLLCCGRATSASDSDSDLDGDETTPQPHSPASPFENIFEWTPEMVESFKLELEKLVILDFLIRNTDRGLDNFMIKPCLSPSSCSPTTSDLDNDFQPHLHLAAIDNSLAFPHTHPQGWRTYPYGWLYLPLPLLDHPWSVETRERYLKKLEDREWWSELGKEMRKEFVRDCEGKEEETEKAWRKQWSVVKGQGWNLVQSLRDDNEGPLELCRRQKVLVWDDYVLVPDLEPSDKLPSNAKLVSSHPIPSPSSSAAPAISYSVSYTRPSLPPQSPHSSKRNPTPPTLMHRRTLSDYTQSRYSYGSFSTSTNREANTRSSSFLRKPLDELSSLPSRSLAGKLFRHSSSTSSTSRTQSDQAAEEVNDETGYSFLRRLDRIEKDEMKRAKKVMKDAKKLGLIDNGSSNDETVGKEDGESARLLSTADERLGDEGSDSEDEEEEVSYDGTPQWGTASEIVFSGNGSGGIGQDRMTVSWHQANEADLPEEYEGRHTSEVQERNCGEAEPRKQMKWLIHERLEYVEAPKRRFKFW